MDYKFTHINENTGTFLRIDPNVNNKLVLGEVLEIGSNEFKVT